MTTQFLFVEAAGEKYAVHHASDDSSTVLNDIHRSFLDEGADGVGALIVVFQNTELLWSIKVFDHTGKTLAKNGTAVPAAVKFLVETKLYKPKDRRETIPIITDAGIVDTLLGVSGVSVDLGRWRFFGEKNNTIKMRLLGDIAVTVLPKSSEETDILKIDNEEESYREKEATLNVYAKESVQQFSEGVGLIRARFFEGGKEIHVSGIGAIAAAIGARHFLQGSVTHHWRVETAAGNLAVRMFPTEEGEHVSLNCPVTFLGAKP